MKDESCFNSTWSLLFALSSSHSLYNIIVPCNWFIKLMMPRSGGWVFNMLVVAFIYSLILQCLDIAVCFPILLFMLFISIIWIFH